MEKLDDFEVGKLFWLGEHHWYDSKDQFAIFLGYENVTPDFQDFTKCNKWFTYFFVTDGTFVKLSRREVQTYLKDIL